MNILIIFTAAYLYLVIVAISMYFFYKLTKEKKLMFLKLTFLSSVVAFIIAKISNHIISSPRPYLIQHIRPIIHASTDNGFPSDHTLLSMTLASVVFAFNKKVGSILGLFAILVGVGRVYARVHHPIDIVGSIIISVVTTYVVWNILRLLKQLN